MPESLSLGGGIIEAIETVAGGEIPPARAEALWNALVEFLREITNEAAQVVDPVSWQRLRQTLKALAERQCSKGDPFHSYAEVYDLVVGLPCLEEFVAGYMEFVIENYGIVPRTADVLSIGCGTGIMEEYMIRRWGIDPERFLGIDISEAMIKAARRRIRAIQADLLEFDRHNSWDVVFQGLNVLQYLHHSDLERAIRKIARLLRPGGIFFGDFITPDHILLYPNVIFSIKALSLRQPKLIRIDGDLYQESEIINVNRLDGGLRVSYEGRHRRHLPPPDRLLGLFEDAFGRRPDAFDAITYEPLVPGSGTCVSTRYIVVVQRA